MSAHSSSPNTSLNASQIESCFDLSYIVPADAAFQITKILLTNPLSVFILYLAYQKWKQQGSLTAASHCDVFTYHLAVMELFIVLGTPILLSGYYSKFKVTVRVGHSLLSVPYCGETCFHVLTCVERYLAVVHPLTYRGLKTARGIRIRNSIIGCVWVICFAWMAMTAVHFPDALIEVYLLSFVVSLAVVAFCSVSVLFVLIRSRPGERGQGKGGVDKSKQRAFLTIMVILVVLCLWFVTFIISLFVNNSASLSQHVKCVVTQISIWINIPSSLVIPLLYIQRSGKLSFCRQTKE